MNVLETVEPALGPETVRRLAETLGETPEGIARAKEAAAPAAFRLLTNQALEGDGATLIARTILETNPGSALSDPDAVAAAAQDPSRDTLGGEAGDLPARIAAYAGIGEAAAAGVLRAALTLALGSIARNASVPLGAENVRRLLRDQENHVERAFPPDFEAPGLRRPAPAAEGGMSVPGQGRYWPAAIAILVVLLIVLFVGLRTCGSVGDPGQEATAPLPSTTPGAEAGSAPVAPAAEQETAAPQAPGAGT